MPKLGAQKEYREENYRSTGDTRSRERKTRTTGDTRS